MHDEAFKFLSRFASHEALTVIEIGSRNINGTARDWFPNAIWTGLDVVNGPMVDVVIDAEEYEPDELVDMVVCCEVFEHTPRWQQIIKCSAAWLKPGGRMLVTCAGNLREPHSAADGGPLRGGEYYSNVDSGELAAEMRAAGLSDVQSETNGPDSYAWGQR